jgi:thymidylate kinase
MRDMHLILLDGLPGSGKSTATDYVANCLNEAGVAARAYYESEDGPSPST